MKRQRWDRNGAGSFARRQPAGFRRLRLEPLEDRRMLAVLTVDNLGDAGLGSLRAAIEVANDNSEADTIEFTVAGTIPLLSELPALDDADGGTLIDATTAPGYDGLPVVVLDGTSAGAAPGLTVDTVGNEIRGLQIQSFDRGGISNGGDLTVTESTVSGNSGLGGITNHGTLTIAHSTLSGNSGGSGSGIYNSVGLVTVTHSTLSGNTTNGFGGGIYNYNGHVIVTHSTLSGNMANIVGSGAGIYNRNGFVTVTHSTLTGNTANDSGGGIYVKDGIVTVTHSTLTGNTANGFGGGIWVQPEGHLNLGHTILAGNTASQVPDAYSFAGATQSLGYNLVGNNSGFTFTPLPGDLVGTEASPIDPLLGPLQDNGGPTFTHTLLPGSPAIDAGDPDFDPSAFDPPLTTDQRGSDRVLDGHGEGTATIDIGAFEQHGPMVFTVTTLDDSGQGSLREAIEQANANLAADTITFDVAGTIRVQSQLPALDDATGGTLIDATTAPDYDGQPVVILDGSDAGAVPGLTVYTSDNEIRGLRIQSFERRGISNGGDLTVTESTVSGNSGLGGIFNDGTLTIDHSTVSDNSGRSGGGISNFTGVVTVTHSTLSGNSATIGAGGGIYNGVGVVTVIHSTISGNTTTRFGGGIYNSVLSTLTIAHSTLTGNEAAEWGGAIHNDHVLNFTHTILAGNSAGSGPDVFDSSGVGINTSLRYNLVGNNSGFTFTPQAGDLVGTEASPIDPLLGPLQDNGGPTFTHALLPASPAIDAGDPDFDPGAFDPPRTTDQRGFDRIRDGHGEGTATIDIGAFELELVAMDYGDAPGPSYSTLLADDGARHEVIPGFYLGSGVDLELNGHPDVDALGDDNDGNDDEDGVVFTSLLTPGQPASVEVTASAAGMLDAWIDFNHDGDWADLGEQIFSSRPLSATTNDLTFDVPASATLTRQTFARFRFSTAGGLSFDGPADDGEVEDYAVMVARPMVFAVTTLDDSGPGSLREAIEAANENPAPDTIVFDVAGTIQVVSELPALSDPFGGTLIDATTAPGYGDQVWDNRWIDIDRPVVILDGAREREFRGLTITSADNEIRGLWVAGFLGGGIYNDTGTLTISHSSLSVNDAQRGGGIYNNRGTLTVSHSILSNNDAQQLGGGIYNGTGTLTIRHSMLVSNEASAGGGIYNDTGTLTVTRSTVYESRAFEGIGIYNNAGTSTISHSTLTRNLSEHSFGSGGGIYNETGTLTISHSTLWLNWAGWNGEGDCIYNGHGLVQFDHTILSGNLSSGYRYSPATQISLGHNLLTYADSDFPFNSQPSDLVGTPGSSIDPMLSPHGVWLDGGPTLTYALLPGSPAIDAGNNADAPSTDQRGFARIVDGDGDGIARIDIGAYEYLASPILGRQIFYNNSAFDGNDPAANQQDDEAIAVDKSPLLPGSAATFANYTSFGRGINGIMVDIAWLPPAAEPLDYADYFDLKVGNDNDPAGPGWSDAPPPIGVAIRPGQGDGGSDRLTIFFDDHAIENQWLQVTVLANEHTGLIEPDVFCFGNAIAETGDSPGDALVATTDLLLARNNPRSLLDEINTTFPYDFNRDRQVNATDVLLARNNQTSFFNALKLIDLAVAEEAASLEELAWLAEARLDQPDAADRTADAQDAVDVLLATYWGEK